VASSTNAVLQEIFTSFYPDFSVITFNQSYVELNSKQLLQKENNFLFSITDEDDNILNLNGQGVIFSIRCFEYNNSFELLYNDKLIKNIKKLMN